MQSASEQDHEAEAGGEAELNEAHIFTVRWERGRLYLDAFWDVSDFVGAGPRTLLAKAVLLDQPPPESLTDFSRHLNSLRLRVRFNSPSMEGPYLVKTDYGLQREDLESYLRSLSPSDYDTFTKGAMI